MVAAIQSIRGFADTLPEQTPLWRHLEETVRAVLGAYGYQEIRLPLVERTELFARSIGEVTDIVEKEMYTFEDRGGERLSLRPEGTAGCVRAGIQHGLLHNATPRLWYSGPMFRYERPQKGRLRQFHQIGVEVYGLEGPDIDAEVILLSARLLRRLGLAEDVRLELNSLGSPAARAVYRERLVAYFAAHREQLDEDSQRRLETNPLRILDSKNPAMQALIEAAPRLLDHLDAESRAHLEGLERLLSAAGVDYRINARLVRGLDYYTRTVFEWVTDRLGAQGTVLAGGRYDGLVEQIGGRATPAVGFALGMERLVALIEERQGERSDPPDAYLVTGADTTVAAFALAERLREQMPALKLLVHCGGGSIKSQFKRADRSGARVALILAEAEAEAGEITVKDLRQGEQQTVRQDALAEHLGRLLGAA